jgi:sugar phosphate isomerase/epimerase
MKTIKGPAVFLAQFMDDKTPFNSLDGLCKWAKELGYIGIQIPTLDRSIIDLDIASESQTYCDEFKGKINSLFQKSYKENQRKELNGLLIK